MNKKWILFVPVLILILFMSGCTADKEVTIKSTTMKAAFNTCIKALKENNYSVTYADLEAGIINAKGSYDVLFGVTPQASLNLTQQGENVEVHVKVFTDKEGSVFNGDGTANSIMNSIVPPTITTTEAKYML